MSEMIENKVIPSCKVKKQQILGLYVDLPSRNMTLEQRRNSVWNNIQLISTTFR